MPWPLAHEWAALLLVSHSRENFFWCGFWRHLQVKLHVVDVHQEPGLPNKQLYLISEFALNNSAPDNAYCSVQTRLQNVSHTHAHAHTHIHIVTLHYIYMHAEKMSWGERDWDSIALDPPTADDSHSCQMVLRETLKPKRMAATTPPGSQWPDSVVSIEFRELSFIRNCDWNSPTCVETLGCAKMNCFLFNFGETRLVNTYHEMPP